jgi:MFS family permease
LVLWVVTFIDASVHQCFFSWTFRFLGVVGIPSNWIQPVMSIGQVAEILTMLILGVTLKRLGWKTTMIVGILGHAVRFAVFAYLPQYPNLIVAVNLIHGICYAFFFATVYIFVDEYFPKGARSSAQGLFNFMILGLGTLVPNFICPMLHDDVYGTKAKVVEDGEAVLKVVKVDYQGLFLVPMFAALVAVVILAVCFHPPKKSVTEATSTASP